MTQGGRAVYGENSVDNGGGRVGREQLQGPMKAQATPGAVAADTGRRLQS